MKELGRVTFSPDTTSGGGSPRVSLRGLPERKKKFFNFNKTTERTRSKKQIKTHIKIIHEHIKKRL